ncbi:MAG: hypothetical protein ACFFBI_13550 [Promethearchaeota archaeon]
MTLVLKKDLSKTISPIHDGVQTYQDIVKLVLNCMFRELSFANRSCQIRSLTSQEYNHIASQTKLPINVVMSIISRFLVKMVYFRKFLRNYTFSDYTHRLKKLQIYLHKISRIAPVFDYKRAKENARILKLKLKSLCFFPQFLTQIAVVIFITDLNDTRFEKKIIQTNLRLLCDCSAYAFHRTRNKLGLN